MTLEVTTTRLPDRTADRVLALPVVLALALAPGALATGPPGSYTTPVFSDGFESGSLIGWANAVVGQAKFTFIP